MRGYNIRIELQILIGKIALGSAEAAGISMLGFSTGQRWEDEGYGEKNKCPTSAEMGQFETGS